MRLSLSILERLSKHQSILRWWSRHHDVRGAVLLWTLAFGISLACFSAHAQERRRPLIFVPGIFGSKLCENGDPTKLLWGSISAWKKLPLLKLEADGRTSKVQVEPCGLIDEFVYFGSLGQDIYGKFLEALPPDYVLGTNLFIFPYDWRLSSFDNAEKFEVAIEEFAKQAKLGKADQFDVVAHSMGGLVVTLSVNRGTNKRVFRLITVSTPFQGSVAVFPSLEEGWGWLQHQFVSMEQVRDTVLSFPAIFELLPTYDKCCALGSGPPGQELDLKKLDDLKRIGWLRSMPSELLAARQRSLMDLRKATSGNSPITVAHMYGAQKQTPEQIYLSADQTPNPDRLIKRKQVSWLGDGTVMDYSAKLSNDLGRLPGAIQHERIMSDADIIKQIKEALAERRPPSKISSKPLGACATSDLPVEIDGAAVDGSERVVSPGQEMKVGLTVRSSRPPQNTSILRTIKTDVVMIAGGERAQIKFEPVDEPQYDNEPAEGGGRVYFYSQNFAANFKAPGTTGDMWLEFRCKEDQKDPIASWDFKVAP